MAKGGFRGMPGGMNQAAMMKQAQKMQAEMLRMQEEMESKTYTATAGGGMVTAEVSGKHQLVNLTIKEEAVDPEDVEMLQDLVVSAVNEALRQAGDAMEKGMSGVTGGLDLSAFGL
jgi:DNA-binding YbaB/EbfC family protein